jgi:hypothetical protein
MVFNQLHKVHHSNQKVTEKDLSCSEMGTIIDLGAETVDVFDDF